MSWEHLECLVQFRSVWEGRSRHALVSLPVVLPWFPAHSTHVSYNAALGASLLIDSEVAPRVSNCWLVRCSGKGVLPSPNGREMISSEVLFAVNCPPLFGF